MMKMHQYDFCPSWRRGEIEDFSQISEEKKVGFYWE